MALNEETPHPVKGGGNTGVTGESPVKIKPPVKKSPVRGCYTVINRILINGGYPASCLGILNTQRVINNFVQGPFDPRLSSELINRA
jgi:hypothetical protein